MYQKRGRLVKGLGYGKGGSLRPGGSRGGALRMGGSKNACRGRRVKKRPMKRKTR